MRKLLGGQPEAAGGELVHGLGLAIDRLALDDERAQQHAERRGVGERCAPIAGGDVLFQQRGEVEPLQELVDQG